MHLANGKTETWVADRTGHMSSQMINVYRRWARGHEELELGEFTPLVDAIPELRKKSAPDKAIQTTQLVAAFCCKAATAPPPQTKKPVEPAF